MLFVITMLIDAQAFAMEAPPVRPLQVPTLPADVCRYIIPFVAESNAYKVAETLRCLNATNKFFHESVQSEDVMLMILERMPYTTNADFLYRFLNKMPVVKKAKLIDWHRNLTDLVKGRELVSAVACGDQKTVSELLKIKNIDLENFEGEGLLNGGDGLPLSQAIYWDHGEIFEMLLKAGANPNSLRYIHSREVTPLQTATLCYRPDMVEKLLDAGADTSYQGRNICVYAHGLLNDRAAFLTYLEKDRLSRIIYLLDNAAAQKKEKLKKYQKTAPGCAIS